MALVNNRRGVGGRKPITIVNPFVEVDEWGDEENLLWNTEHRLDIRIEDVLVGCARAVAADTNRTRELVDWKKTLRIYRSLHRISTETVQEYLQCSKVHAGRYVSVIKLANPFLIRLLEGKSGTNVTNYVNFSTNQVKDGYLDILMEAKPEKRANNNLTKQDKGEQLCKVIQQVIRK